jgi:hypothetical protein
MSATIRIVKVDRKPSIDVKKFEKSAKVVLEKVVKPQIERASKVELKKVIVKCNNPV